MSDNDAASNQPSEWFIRRGNTEHGPFSSKQMRAMATSGKLKADDMVQKGRSAKWAKASSVKGLFPGNEERVVPATAPTTPEAPATDPPTKKTRTPRTLLLGCAGAFVLMTLVCSGLMHLGSTARDVGRNAVEQANRPPENAPAHARLAGMWRGNDGQIYDFRFQRRRGEGYQYEDVQGDNPNGHFPSVSFDDDGRMTYISAYVSIFAEYRLEDDNRMKVVGKGTAYKGDQKMEALINDTWTRIDGNAQADSAPSFPTFSSAKGAWKCRKTGLNFLFEPLLVMGPDGKKAVPKSPLASHQTALFTVTKGGEVWTFDFHENGIIYASPKENVDNRRSRIGQFTFNGQTLDIKLALTASRDDLGTIPWEYEFELVRQ